MEVLIILIVIVGSCLFFYYKSKKMAKEERKAIANLKIQQVETYFEKAKQNERLPEVETYIMLKPDEKAFLQDNVKLLEIRKVTKSQRGGGAVRVMKGVYIGGSSGTSRSHDELREIDQGHLILTNKRIVFDGGTNTRDFNLDKIISVAPGDNGIEIAVEGRLKSLIYTGMQNPYLWAALIPSAKNF